mmetsp:Transcript_59/g.131  ORF Transcript_59/g.131 Transcript_59/m.131 type:complete len:248 (+) Transcript_59:122-865(+)
MAGEDVEKGAAAQGDEEEEDDFKDGPLKKVAGKTIMERVAGFLAGAAIATSLAALILEKNPIVKLGAIFSLILGPYLYYQQTRLTDIATLKETQKVMAKEVDRLQKENERLSGSIDKLGGSVDKLEDVENALDTITKTQGQSVSTFADQVKKNKEILATMKENLKGTVMQNLLSVIMASDSDQDNVVDPEEVDTLLRRIRGIGGVEVDEAKFRKVFSGGSVSDLMGVVSNLLRDDVPEEEQIFKLTD